MFYSDLVRKASLISFNAHKDDLDKGGYPYIFHPFFLASQMEDENTCCVAFLHDVIEDHGDIYSFNFLKQEGFTDDILMALNLLTHKKEVPYMEYIKEIGKNSIARKVKLADLQHNMDNKRLNGQKSKKYETYQEAFCYLSEIENLKLCPDSLQEIIQNKPCILEDIGESGAKVFIFDDMVLKIQEINDEVENEVNALTKINDKIPCAKLLYHSINQDFSYLLTTKVDGKMLCDEEYLINPKLLIHICAKALKTLWTVDTDQVDLPFMLEKRLEKARYNVFNDLCDVNEKILNDYGFTTPKEVLNWLEENKPDEDLSLVHGDFCLPNIFAKEDQFTGFIDIGRVGIADKYMDIAICLRSLKMNFDGTYTNISYPGYDPIDFYRELGIEIDEFKIKYYTLLDEL